MLRDVTLTLPPGRIVEVTGPNGAGKSTLLRLLAGLRTPGRGSITGRTAPVGYAPERFPADQPFTARGYLTHMARLRRISPALVGPWADRLGFSPLLDEPLRELSKGSAHKVGLMQALLPDPGLLVLDEPFAGLDPGTRSALPAILSERAAAGATVVVSDHQRCLRDVPGIDRLQISGHTVTPAIAERAEPAVIEVVVPADDATTVLAKLCADGYQARRAR